MKNESSLLNVGRKHRPKKSAKNVGRKRRPKTLAENHQPNNVGRETKKSKTGQFQAFQNYWPIFEDFEDLKKILIKLHHVFSSLIKLHHVFSSLIKLHQIFKLFNNIWNVQILFIMVAEFRPIWRPNFDHNGRMHHCMH